MSCTSSNSRIMVASWPDHSSIKLLLVVVQSLPLSSASTFLYFLMFSVFDIAQSAHFSFFHLSLCAFPPCLPAIEPLDLAAPYLLPTPVFIVPTFLGFSLASLMLSTVAQLHSLSPISTVVFSCPFYSFATLSNRFLSTISRLSLVHPLLPSHILSSQTPPYCPPYCPLKSTPS